MTPVVLPGGDALSSVGSGNDHTCWLVSPASVRCSGRNDRGQLGNGTGLNSASLVDVSGISSANSIDSSLFGYTSCAVLTDATARCWGGNEYGQLGDGVEDRSTGPCSRCRFVNGLMVVVVALFESGSGAEGSWS